MEKISSTIMVRDLVKNFGDFTAVNRISFDVHRGEIFGFLGPNGSGKTTTIRMMLGLLPPTEGSIEVLGIRVPEHVQQILPRIGYMSQQFSLYNDLTVQQNLVFYGQAYGLQPDSMADLIHKAVSISGLEGYENKPTKDLSGGWRQRLALSAAIIHRPEVVFLDEPTAGVDPVSRRAFWDLLYILISEGITVFITTHYMDEAEHCHRLAFIQHGNIIAQGTPTEIKKTSLSGEVLEITTSQPEQLITLLSDIRQKGGLPGLDVELFGSTLHVLSQQPKNHLREIKSIARAAGLKIINCTQVEPTLEDVFIACMQDQKPGGIHEK